nr:ABC transporter six-transmembrane domain-containing protein [uncultured Moraxella sp.]
MSNRILFNSLKHIAITHKQKLMATFSLVAIENILLLIYPLIAGFAVNAVMQGKMWQALSYAFLVLIIWLIGSARRAVDTRAFVRIYADLVVPVIFNQRTQHSTSTVVARANLSRQFVEFFEQHLPMIITSVFSIVGSVVMLLWIEFWSGVVVLAILLGFIAILPSYVAKNDKLYFKLNNRLEKEVGVIERTSHNELTKHYDLISRLKIAISNREAVSFLAVGVAMAILFGTTLTLLTVKGYGSAGHIYAVITYLWTFAISLDDMPNLIEKYSELKDIGGRVDVEKS